MTVNKIVTAVLLTIFWLNSYGTDFYKATTTLNVRSGAGTYYEALFILGTEDEVEIVSHDNSWSKIKFNGQTGYASSKYLEYSRSTEDNTISESQEEYETKNKYIVLGIIGAVILLIIFLSFSSSKKKKNQTKLDEEIEVEKVKIEDNSTIISESEKPEQPKQTVSNTTTPTKSPSMIGYGVMFAIIGLIIGYIIFGKIPLLGEYISPEVLFGLKSNDNIFESLITNAIVEPIRQKVLISATISGIVGVIIASLKKNN